MASSGVRRGLYWMPIHTPGATGSRTPIPAVRENHFRTEGLAISGHSPVQPGSSLGLACERLQTVFPTVINPRGPGVDVTCAVLRLPVIRPIVVAHSPFRLRPATLQARSST